MPPILIACLGNIFYGDDAFGTEVARGLAACRLPENVRLVDFGIRGLDLAFELANDYALVVLVDAIEAGAAPGDLFVLEPKMPEKNAREPAHDLTPARALDFALQLEKRPRKMLLVACEPANVEFREGLSAPVAAAVPRAVAKILELVEKESNLQG